MPNLLIIALRNRVDMVLHGWDWVINWLPTFLYPENFSEQLVTLKGCSTFCPLFFRKCLQPCDLLYLLCTDILYTKSLPYFFNCVYVQLKYILMVDFAYAQLKYILMVNFAIRNRCGLPKLSKKGVVFVFSI